MRGRDEETTGNGNTVAGSTSVVRGTEGKVNLIQHQNEKQMRQPELRSNKKFSSVRKATNSKKGRVADKSHGERGENDGRKSREE